MTEERVSHLVTHVKNSFLKERFDWQIRTAKPGANGFGNSLQSLVYSNKQSAKIETHLFFSAPLPSNTIPATPQ